MSSPTSRNRLVSSRSSGLGRRTPRSVITTVVLVSSHKSKNRWSVAPFRESRLISQHTTCVYSPASIASMNSANRSTRSPGEGGGPGAVYTARAGDTLASIAQAVYGDASLWYLIADANGLRGDAVLAAGAVVWIARHHRPR